VTEAEAALRENYGEQRIALPQDRGSRQVGGAAVLGLAGLQGVGVCGSRCRFVRHTTRGHVGNVARASGDMVAAAGDRPRSSDQETSRGGQDLHRDSLKVLTGVSCSRKG
jgi:hypothetical protein